MALSRSLEGLELNFHEFVRNLELITNIANIVTEFTNKPCPISDEMLSAVVTKSFQNKPDDIVSYFLTQINNKNVFLPCQVMGLFIEHASRPIQDSARAKLLALYDCTEASDIVVIAAVLARLGKDLSSEKKSHISSLARSRIIMSGTSPDVIQQRVMACKILQGFTINMTGRIRNLSIDTLFEYIDDENDIVSQASRSSMLNIIFSGSSLDYCATLSRCLTKQIEMISEEVKGKAWIKPEKEKVLLGYKGNSDDKTVVLNSDTTRMATSIAERFASFKVLLAKANLIQDYVEDCSDQRPEITDEIISKLVEKSFGNDADEIVSFFLQQLKTKFDFMACRIISLNISNATKETKTDAMEILTKLSSRETKDSKQLALYVPLAKLADMLPATKQQEMMDKAIQEFAYQSVYNSEKANEQLHACDILEALGVSMPQYRKQCIDVLAKRIDGYDADVNQASRKGLIEIMRHVSKLEFSAIMSRCLTIAMEYLVSKVEKNPNPNSDPLVNIGYDERLNLFGYSTSTKYRAMQRAASTESVSSGKTPDSPKY